MSPFIALLLSLCLIGSATRVCAAAPNVLIILTDDQGYGDLSIHGNPHLQTPNLDRLGRTGVRFEHFQVNSFCAPTRAALLTAHSMPGIFSSQRPVPDQVGSPDLERTTKGQTGCRPSCHS